MSSRFSVRQAVPQPPPICRKSIPDASIPIWPPNVASAWIGSNLITTLGTPQPLNQIQAITLQPTARPAWSARWLQGTWQWEVILAQTLDETKYEAAVSVTSTTTFDFAIAVTNDFTPISTIPLNSGILQPTILAGSGNATIRFML